MNTLRSYSTSNSDIASLLLAKKNRDSSVISQIDDITLNCTSIAAEGIKNYGLPAADVIGDITSAASTTKRALQIDKILLPVSDEFNNGFTVATALIAAVCYIGAAFAIYLDDVKFQRTKNKFKVGLFFVTGAQCGILSTYATTTLALPSFILCTIVDLGTALDNAHIAYKKTTFEGWLEESLDELSSLNELCKLGSFPYSKKQDLLSQYKELKETIDLRYAANCKPEQHNDKIDAIVKRHESHWEPGDLALMDLTPAEKAKENEIKDKLIEEFHYSLLNVISRIATLTALVLLKIAVLSVTLQPLVVVTCLGFGALTHGVITYYSYPSVFSSSNSNKICVKPPTDEHHGPLSHPHR